MKSDKCVIKGHIVVVVSLIDSIILPWDFSSVVIPPTDYHPGLLYVGNWTMSLRLPGNGTQASSDLVGSRVGA